MRRLAAAQIGLAWVRFASWRLCALALNSDCIDSQSAGGPTHSTTLPRFIPPHASRPQSGAKATRSPNASRRPDVCKIRAAFGLRACSLPLEFRAEVDFGSAIKSHSPTPLSFEWDDNKARSNAAKHGVRFEEAATVFADALSLTIPDPAHSQAEDRFVIVGSSYQGKLLVVVHTERGDNIRGISARRASKRERKAYEEAS